MPNQPRPIACVNQPVSIPHTAHQAASARARGVVRWARVALAGSSFALFGLGGVVLGWLVLPVIWLCGGTLSQRRRRCQRIVRRAFWMFHEYMRICRLLEFRASHAATHPNWPSGRAVLIANHPTLIDTPAILACVDSTCCIVTPWFAKNPLLWPLLKLCGHIVQTGHSLGAGLSVVEKAKQRLSEGDSLLVFPEGTRSPLQGLGSFQRAIFEIARRERVPIIPIAIHVSPHVLTGKTPWYDLPGCAVRYRLEPLEPWLPTEYPVGPRAASQLAECVRQKLARRLGQQASRPEPSHDRMES